MGLALVGDDGVLVQNYVALSIKRHIFLVHLENSSKALEISR